MRLLQLGPCGGEATALDLHPLLSVVTDLTPDGRACLLRAVHALPGGRDPRVPGLIEAHGILLDLTPQMLALLDLAADRPVIVTADDVAVASSGAAHHALEGARSRRRQAEAALESARAAVARSRMHLVPGGDAGRPPDLVPGPAALAEERNALEARRAELQATIEWIERSVARVANIDLRPIHVLLDSIHHPRPPEWVPSPRAQQLADELTALLEQQAALTRSLEAHGRGYRAAMDRVEQARAAVAAAEQAVQRPELTDLDRVVIQRAHDLVVEAERRAHGRAGRRRLEEAIEHEQAILGRLGFPTWSAYARGSGLPDAGPAVEQARAELAEAERTWTLMAYEIQADPAHRELLDRLELAYAEAFELLGGDEDQDDIVGRLRALRIPVQVTLDELVDALAYQLELAGMAVPPEHRRADHLVPAAQAFVADVSAEQARLGDLTRRQLDAVTELQEIEQRLARVAAQAGAHQDGHPSVGPVTAEMLAVGVDVDGLAAELDAARAHERACEEAVEPEVMTGAAEAFLVARLDAHRRVSYAGSVPLVLDDALAPFDDAARARVLERLSREAGDVQIVYVTGGDPAVIAWADQAGFERAAVVRWPSAQP